MNNIILGFIIGGSPSTGSSLLRQILNRHSSINCAHETHIWAKKDIVRKWKDKKSKLNTMFFQLKDAGLFPFSGINKKEIPNFNEKEFDKLVDNSNDIFTFFEGFMRQFYKLNSGQIYGEKTPANVINFDDILAVSPKVICIHTVRNPYDTIASLVARGKSIPEAVGFYLHNTSIALNVKNSDRVLTIHYEKLVDDTSNEIERILSVLSLIFEDQMLVPQKINPNEVTKIDSWKYDETAKIGKGSVGRFDELTAEQKEDIASIAWSLRLEEAGQYDSIPSICDKLGYSIIKPSGSSDNRTKAMFASYKSQYILKNIKLRSFPFYYQ